MAKAIVMPQIGVSDETAILAEWHVKIGELVNIGQILFTLETDKSTFEVASDYSGTILALLCEQNDEVAVASAVCIIGEPNESYDLSEFVTSTVTSKPQFDPLESTPTESQTAKQTFTIATSDGKYAISPRARATAAKLGIEPHFAKPTGAEGRIMERDVLAIEVQQFPDAPEIQPVAVLSPPEIVDFTDIPHSRIRKTIAKNMLNSIQNIPQLTHHHSFDATRLLELRARCKSSNNAKLSGITIGDLVLFAVTRTLKAHPNVNSHYYNEYLRVFGSVNLGVAVDTPRGLMVPTIFGADALSASDISVTLKQLAEKCRSGSIEPTSLSGASFTVSNLGAYGVEMFTPVINPPQVAILGVCASVNRVRVDSTIYPAMGLSLTYDHRAIDGAPASQFLRELCENLENIDLIGLL